MKCPRGQSVFITNVRDGFVYELHVGDRLYIQNFEMKMMNTFDSRILCEKIYEVGRFLDKLFDDVPNDKIKLTGFMMLRSIALRVEDRAYRKYQELKSKNNHMLDQSWGSDKWRNHSALEE